jgi:subtilase family serine protease
MPSLRSLVAASAALAGLLGAPVTAAAAPREPGDAVTTKTLGDAVTYKTPGGLVIVPASSMAHPEIPGLMHTNVRIFVPTGRGLRATAPTGIFETPASLACVYGETQKARNCNPKTLTKVATTGSKVIAIVDAYDDPHAAADLTVYSRKFHLPAVTTANFQTIYATGSAPAQDPTGGWELEESLDIEMAHALAPGARVVLVEAATASNTDLLAAEKVAIKLVHAAGGGEVSNSWGGPESADEAADMDAFDGANVVVFAAAGDTPGVSQPAVLPNVISVGGTSILRTPAGLLQEQVAWSDGGGGISAYVPIPSYQNAVSTIAGSHRASPDIAMDANPSSGVWVYDTIAYNGTVLDWIVIGGTSAASPAAAALVNSAGSFKDSTATELSAFYADIGAADAFTDIKIGFCADNAAGHASAGFDLCTGIGAPLGFSGK